MQAGGPKRPPAFTAVLVHEYFGNLDFEARSTIYFGPLYAGTGLRGKYQYL
jgi:hypothetical protein